MDIETVILPRTPGVLSARGLLLADVRADESQAYRGDGLDAEAMADTFADLEATHRERFGEMGFDADEVTLDRAADMRYVGQSYELTVDVDDPLDEDAVETTVERFHRDHERLYGYAMREEPVEAVTLRVTGRVPTPPLRDSPEATGDPQRERRKVYFEDRGFVESDVYWRPGLDVGETVEGPAILEGTGSTALVPPAGTVLVADDGSIRIER
ncbi:MAG: hypothetical protein ABEH58_00840 [Haloplanus sp.]